MKTIYHKAETRGHENHGWLDTHHTFSFAEYYNPERMHFGVLRVLNDDVVEAGKGFGTHPHENMEIISIPLSGVLVHKDSMGSEYKIKKNDVQVMSAGTGITHSEFNGDQNNPVKFLQIWIYPNRKDVEPRYDQMTFASETRKNRFIQIVSPSAEDEGMWIYQNAWLHMGKFDKDVEGKYILKKEGNGVYIFLIEGEIIIDNQKINKRDGFGILGVNSFSFNASVKSEMLLMEVPMAV
jgi:quercetin 2,3-dioxygenase